MPPPESPTTVCGTSPADQADEFRFALKGVQRFLKCLQHGDPVLTKDVGLRRLAAREFFEKLAFCATEGCTLFFALIGHLDRNLCRHEPGLFVSCGAGLFALGAFALRRGFTLIGARELLGQFVRVCAIKEAPAAGRVRRSGSP